MGKCRGVSLFGGAALIELFVTAPGVAFAQEAPPVATTPNDQGTPASLTPSDEESAAPATELQEIVITAQKRAQNINDVPISISAVTGEELRVQNITSSISLGRAVPNLTVTDYGNPIITVYTLRGVSQFDFADHQESPVAVFVDGSYVPYLSGVGTNFFDLERVEVLRGPQGTLFGRNATGGVVQVISAQPTNSLSAYGLASFGSFDAVRLEGAVSGPLGGGFRARLSGLIDRHDGYFRNTLGGRKGDGNNRSFRGQLARSFGGNSDFTLTVRHSRDSVSSSPYQAAAAYPDPITGDLVLGNGQDFADFCAAFFFAPVGPDPTDCLSGDVDDGRVSTITNNRRGGFNRNYFNANATLNLDLGPATLTSITTYGSIRKSYRDEDSDGTSLDLLYFDQNAKANDIAQELRLAGRSGAWQWLVGAYFLQIDGKYDSQFSFFPGDVGFEALIDNFWTLRTLTAALFGQSEWSITDQLKLTTGLRYTWDRKRFQFETNCIGPGCDPFGLNDPSIVQGSGYDESVPGAKTRRNSGNWDGKLQLSYMPNSDWLLYAGVSRGTKSGGYNAGTLAFFTVEDTIFDDEVLTSYEAGLKATLADGRVQLNTSAFYYDYKDVQVFSQLGLQTLTFNRDGRIYGAEAELNARITPRLSAGTALSLLNSRLKPIEVPNLVTGTRAESQRVPNAPARTISAYVRQIVPMGSNQLSLAADIKRVSSQKLNLINYAATREPAYTFANARIGFGPADERWEVAGFVQNLTNARYRVAASPFVTTNGSLIEIYAPPRTYGVSLLYKY